MHFVEVGFQLGFGAGLLFIILSMVAAAASFEGCRRAAEHVLAGQQPLWARSLSSRAGQFKIKVGLGIFLATMVLSSSAYLQSVFFVANNPGGAAVDDGLHLVARMVCAVGGATLSSFIGGPPSRTNAASCALVGLAYAAARLYRYDPSVGSLRMKMAFETFTGTFCGTLSSFAALFSTTHGLWAGASKGKQLERDAVEVSTNIFVALFSGLIYYAAAKKGWDITSHSFFEREGSSRHQEMFRPQWG